MLTRKGVWEGPYIELARCVMGPLVAYGQVRLWRCRECGLHYYSANPLWEGQENEVKLERVDTALVLSFYKECRTTRSGKHYVCPAHTTPMIAQGLRLVPEALEWALSKPYTLLAIFGTPKLFPHEVALIADHAMPAEVETDICPHCYAQLITRDPDAVRIGLYTFRPITDNPESPRIRSCGQPGVEEFKPGELWSFDVKPSDAEILLRRYRWGQLGAIFAPDPPIRVGDTEFETNCVEFTLL